METLDEHCKTAIPNSEAANVESSEVRTGVLIASAVLATFLLCVLIAVAVFSWKRSFRKAAMKKVTPWTSSQPDTIDSDDESLSTISRQSIASFHDDIIESKESSYPSVLPGAVQPYLQMPPLEAVVTAATVVIPGSVMSSQGQAIA